MFSPYFNCNDFVVYKKLVNYNRTFPLSLIIIGSVIYRLTLCVPTKNKSQKCNKKKIQFSLCSSSLCVC